MGNTNKSKGVDMLYAVAKGSIGAIPIAGSLASEVLGVLIASPIERRREMWMNEVGARLLNLESKGLIDIEKLEYNDRFIDAVLNTTSLALKTAENKKIKAFQNIVINTALGFSPNETLSKIFLSFLDRFSETHIALLHIVRSPQTWFSLNLGLDINRDEIFNSVSSLGDVIKIALPEFANLHHITDLVWSELFNNQLVVIESLRTMQTSSGALSDHTSNLGKEFINYITEKKVE